MKYHISIMLLLSVGISLIVLHLLRTQSEGAPPFVENVTAESFETATFALG